MSEHQNLENPIGQKARGIIPISPIFKCVSDQLRVVKIESACHGENLGELEARMASSVDQIKEELVTAWLAETGLLPSESVICHGFTNDGLWRCFVESKSDNDKWANVDLFRDEVEVMAKTKSPAVSGR